MNIYEIYRYADPHTGWGYGNHVAYVLADNEEMAEDERHNLLGFGSYYGYGVKLSNSEEVMVRLQRSKEIVQNCEEILEEK